MGKHIPCECKFKFSSTTCNTNQQWNNKTCQCECKNYRKCKKKFGGILAHAVMIASIADISVIECD